MAIIPMIIKKVSGGGGGTLTFTPLYRSFQWYEERTRVDLGTFPISDNVFYIVNINSQRDNANWLTVFNGSDATGSGNKIYDDQPSSGDLGASSLIQLSSGIIRFTAMSGISGANVGTTSITITKVEVS